MFTSVDCRRQTRFQWILPGFYPNLFYSWRFSYDFVSKVFYPGRTWNIREGWKREWIYKCDKVEQFIYTVYLQSYWEATDPSHDDHLLFRIALKDLTLSRQTENEWILAETESVTGKQEHQNRNALHSFIFHRYNSEHNICYRKK